VSAIEKEIVRKRDELLAERAVLLRRRKELLAEQRRVERELADCRAAERVFWSGRRK
jgi:hypothetical protein